MDFVNKQLNGEIRPELELNQRKNNLSDLHQTTDNFIQNRNEELNNLDFKKMFNDLENGIFDLNIGFTNEAKLSLENSKLNKFFNYNVIENKTNIDSDNNFNGHYNINLNNNLSYNLNDNLINQSYKFAKNANEYKEKFNDVSTAISYYTKAIELNSFEFRFYYNRSICLQQANRLNEALDDADAAIRLMPTARKPYIRKAEIHSLLNKYNEAENILNYCLKLEDATDIPTELVQEEIYKLIKTVLTKCGLSSSIIEQTSHCSTIEEAMDLAFNKQMEQKLNSHKFVTERSYASVICSENNNKLAPISKSIDSQETIDYYTDEELNNCTPTGKLSFNDELFNYNKIASPIRKDSLEFKDAKTNKQLVPLTNKYIYNDNTSNSTVNENIIISNTLNENQNFTNNQSLQTMNRKRNSISLCEPTDTFVKSLNLERFSQSNPYGNNNREKNKNGDSFYSKSLGSNMNQLQSNVSNQNMNITKNFSASKQCDDIKVDPKYKEQMERNNCCTNLIGYKGLWLGNVSSSCSRERLISIFRKYGEPIVHQLKQSPCVFIKYNNEKSPTDAIQDLHGKILLEIVHNKNEPIKLHFECNRRQQEENFPKDKMPRNFKNGECYYWRTIGCSLGKSCPKIHIPINEKIDFQMWMLNNSNHKSN